MKVSCVFFPYSLNTKVNGMKYAGNAIGLRETRYREFLLDIDFAKRETFAFACEAYGRILELGQTLRARRRLLEQFRRESEIPGLVEDKTELFKILHTAVESRNGWKQILKMCSQETWRRRTGTVYAVV
jgi:hypothetical protein